MTEEVRITYKRKPGAGPNYPKESDLPADEGAYIAKETQRQEDRNGT